MKITERDIRQMVCEAVNRIIGSQTTVNEVFDGVVTFQDGDTASMSDLYDAAMRGIRKMEATHPCKYFTKEDREDTIMKAIESAQESSTYKSMGDVKGYIYKVAMCKYIDFLRSEAPKRQSIQYMDGYNGPTYSESPEQEYIRKERNQEARALIKRILDTAKDEKTRQIYSMMFSGDYTFDEISQKTGVKSATLRVIKSRLLDRMAAMYRNGK